MKTCIACGIEQPLSEFPRARRDKPYLMRSCRRCQAAKQHAWYSANRGAWLETQRRYVENNREAVRDAQRKARERRKQDPAYVERLRAESREYHRANSEKRSIREWRRLARIASCTVNDFTARQWRALVEAHGGRCAYCGTRSLRLQKEHVIPLSHGGDHTARNIVPSCQPCNLKKQHAWTGRRAYPFLVIPNRFVA